MMEDRARRRSNVDIAKYWWIQKEESTTITSKNIGVWSKKPCCHDLVSYTIVMLVITGNPRRDTGKIQLIIFVMKQHILEISQWQQDMMFGVSLTVTCKSYQRSTKLQQITVGSLKSISQQHQEPEVPLRYSKTNNHSQFFYIRYTN